MEQEYDEDEPFINNIEEIGEESELMEIKGRHIIRYGTRIYDGIYIPEDGTNTGIIFDERQDSALNRMYSMILDSITNYKPENIDGSKAIIFKIIEIINREIDYYEGNIDFIHNINSLQRVILSMELFLDLKKMKYYHRTLLVGYFIEKLIREGKLYGGVYINRNISEEGGHAWIEYFFNEGVCYIIDLSNGEVKTLDQLDNNRLAFYRKGYTKGQSDSNEYSEYQFVDDDYDQDSDYRPDKQEYDSRNGKKRGGLLGGLFRR